ncbi:MAG: hypothetical protein ACTSRT_20640 [Promethearchaeota archaeon]
MRKILPLVIIIFLIGINKGICSKIIDSNDLFLNIDSPEEIIETYGFTVTIMTNETPVEDVIVILMDNIRRFKEPFIIEKTDSLGQVQFTAPQIIYSRYNKTYSIFASKVGYITNEKIITVINIPNLLIKEEIKSGYKKDEIVTITIIDNSSKSITGATIRLEDNTYYSGDNGKVTLTMPSYNGYYKLIITKEGYANYLTDIRVNEPYLDYSPLIGFLCAVFGFVAFIVILIIVIFLIYRERKK